MTINTDERHALAIANRLLDYPNKAKCRICEDVIESKHVHDWVSCKGGHIFLDGGREYRRAGTLKDGVHFEDIMYCG